MTEFTDREYSKEHGKPYELYRFIWGPEVDQAYLYTNAHKDIEMGGGTFVRLPIDRKIYRTTGKAERDTMMIDIPVRSPLSNLFLEYPPPVPVAVTVFQGHFDENDEPTQPLAVWMGWVTSSARQVNKASLSCESTVISLKRPGLKRNWQYGCPYVLYGNMCKAVREDFQKDVLVEDVQNGVPVFAAGWNDPWPAEKFIGGWMRWRSDVGVEYRTIRAADATTMQFNGVLRDIAAGDTVSVVLGCNHQMGDCRDIFNNIQNYGGQPWIPLSNPVKFPNFW